MRLDNLLTIKKRKEFLAASKSNLSVGRRSLFVQAVRDPFNSFKDRSNFIRVGFTVSRKVGNAVVRNKVKRQFRVLAQKFLYEYANKGYYYIIVANKYTSKNNFKNLCDDLLFCLKVLNLHGK